MSRLRARWSIVLPLVALGGCYPDPDKVRHPNVGVAGSGGGGMGGGIGVSDAAATGGTGMSVDAAPGIEVGPLLPPNAAADNCTDFGAAWCEKSRQCQTRDFDNLGGGAVCATRMRLWCEALLTTPADTGWVPAAFKTCIGSWSVMTCDDWRDFDLEILKGESCYVTGGRPPGAGCWSFSQCGTGECGGTTVCGKCVPRGPVDSACMGDADCQRGLVCAQRKCSLAGRLGNACSEARPCRRSLLCKNGVCAAKLAEGQPCTDHEVCAGGLLCNADKMVCGRAVAGARCSDGEPDGTVLYCGSGGSCQSSTGMCFPPPRDNAACTMDGPDCLWPADCLGGRCLLITPANCPASGGPPADAGTAAPDAPAAATGPNNSAVLSGPEIGAGTLSASELSRPLKVNVTTPNPRFEIGAARALGPGKAILWVIPVKSLSTGLDCGLSAGTIVLRDAAGAAIATKDPAFFFTGSMGVAGGVWTDNCLRAGETGHVFGIVTSDTVDLFATVDALDLAITSTGPGTLPPARVVPVSYRAADAGFAVTIRNEGPGPAKVTGDSLSIYVLLDAAGVPLDWSFLDTATPDGTLAPGATAELSPSFFFFRGKASRMLVLVDFDAP